MPAQTFLHVDDSQFTITRISFPSSTAFRSGIYKAKKSAVPKTLWSYCTLSHACTGIQAAVCNYHGFHHTNVHGLSSWSTHTMATCDTVSQYLVRIRLSSPLSVFWFHSILQLNGMVTTRLQGKSMCDGSFEPCELRLYAFKIPQPPETCGSTCKTQFLWECGEMTRKIFW